MRVHEFIRHCNALALRSLLTALLLCLAANSAAIDRVLPLRSDTGTFSVGSWLDILQDRSGELDIDTVRDSKGWKQWHQDAVSLGITEDDWWFRFSAVNQAPWETLFLLEIAYSSLDYVNIYVVDNGVVQNHYVMGDHYPFHSRPIDHHNFITPISWPSGKQYDIYIHARTSGAMQLPLTLWWQADFYQTDQKRQVAEGLYYGAMIIMLVYNIFMYFGVRDQNFLFYSGFVACIALFVSSLTGYSYQYFWPESPKWNGTSIGFFLSFAVMFAIMFTHRFLFSDLRSSHWLLRSSLVAIYIITSIMIVSSMLLPYTISLILVIVGSVVACFGALVIGAYGWVTNVIAARYYVLAWSSLLIGGIILAGNKFSVIPQNLFTDNAVQIGSSMLVALLSFAIAHRINEERRRRYDAQLETLAHEREARLAKEEALQAQQQANRELEKKVRERTEDLRKANSILEELSATDVLTGLKNRRSFDETAKREYVRCFRYQRPIALVFVDIDHFKKFNDVYGHLIGDEALRTVARILAHAAVRDSDMVARYGGEEFCILLPETETEGAVAVGERVRAQVEREEFLVNGQRVPITVSLGVSCHRPSSPDLLDSLIREADEALYDAKANGRNQVIAHKDSINQTG